MIKEKLSNLFQKLMARMAAHADEVAIQSYVPQDVLHYENFLRSLPEKEFVTAEGRAMKAVVAADFLPYYRASLVATEDLSTRGASSYSLYIRLERKAEQEGGSEIPLIGYFPVMCTQNEQIKEGAMQEWNANESFALSWLSRDLGTISKNKWQRVPNEASMLKSAPSL